jgi:LDH2 family malate/lactate/ureidoglycolate dehydrogenase
MQDALGLTAQRVQDTLMMCLDVQRFRPLATFHEEVAQLFGFVRSAPLAHEREANGVPIEDETWRQIQECAAEVGVRAG